MEKEKVVVVWCGHFETNYCVCVCEICTERDSLNLAEVRNTHFEFIYGRLCEFYSIRNHDSVVHPVVDSKLGSLNPARGPILHIPHHLSQ